jgi:hypothetical protein
VQDLLVKLSHSIGWQYDWAFDIEAIFCSESDVTVDSVCVCVHVCECVCVCAPSFLTLHVAFAL